MHKTNMAVVLVDTSGNWDDEADWTPVAVFTDERDAENYTEALKSNGKAVWIQNGVPVAPETPDNWTAIERDATVSPASYCRARGLDRDIDWQDMAEGYEKMALDLVARCKKLAGVE